MTCSNCGRSMPEGAVFCSNCGTRYAKKLCSACGAELKEGQLFCHVCGLKYEEVQGPSSTAPMQKKGSAAPMQEKGSAAKFDAVLEREVSVKKVFNILCKVAYVGIILFMLYCAGDDFWYYAWGEGLRLYRVYWHEMSSFWLTLLFAIAGSIYEIYYVRKIRSGKEVTKGNRRVRIILFLLTVICLISFGVTTGLFT